MIFTLLIPILSIFGHILVTADNTTDYIHHLEKEIADLKSHNHATEQKQAAVLASILSKLQAQEEKIQELTDDLQNITTNFNSTTSTTGDDGVAFEASTTSPAKPSLVHFQNLKCNVGGGYNATRGTFIAPTTGTYHFWFSAYIHVEDYTYTTHIVLLQVKGSEFGSYASIADTKRTRLMGNTNLYRILVQGQHVVSLKAGDVVSVVFKSTIVQVKPGSTFGGMLLRY